MPMSPMSKFAPLLWDSNLGLGIVEKLDKEQQTGVLDDDA